MLDRTPLSTLLSWAWVAHVMEIDNAFEAVSAARVGHRFRISLAMWANGLRHIDEDGVTVQELRARARASCNIGGLERWGWVLVGDPGVGRRNGYGTHRGITGSTVLRPSRAGVYARRAWPKVVSAVEERWTARFGSGPVDALRAALSSSVQTAGAMPWSSPEVHPTDGFRSHVMQSGDSEDPERPLVALLGQALTQITVELETDAQVSLPLGANLLRVIDANAVPLRELPRLGGISKEAVAMTASYLNRRGLASTAQRVISLTTDGLDALDDYRRRSVQADRAMWRADRATVRAALQNMLTQTAALSEGLRPPDGCWRAENPYLAQTRRLVDNPIAALPWQPMVLHRGGWPDGS